MTGRLSVLGAVLASPLLRRAEAAYGLFAFCEWSTWVAMIVYAYSRGGAFEAGLIAFLELAPSALVAPIVAGLGDRFARDRVLLRSYMIQAVFMAATAVAIVVGSEPPLVYAFAIVAANLVSFSRPLHAAFMPEISRSPDELTAANVVTGMAESGGSLLGPLGAGLLIGLSGPAAVFTVAAVGCGLSCLAIVDVGRRIRRPDAQAGVVPIELELAHGHELPPVAAGEAPRATVAAPARADRGLVGGLAAIAADRRLLSVIVIATWCTFLVGAMDILYAVLAIDLLGLGGDGVGFVGALGGVGAVGGAAAGLALVGRERLGGAMIASAALFGIGIAAIGIAPASIATPLLIVLAGLGSGLSVVASQTLIQRLAGDDVMSRVFGLLQGLMMGATALGALAVPFIVGAVEDRLTFVLIGVSLPIVALVAGVSLVRGDRLPAARAAELRLLRAVPMLGPLSAPVLERLAAAAVPAGVPAGTVVVREGDVGDRFFVIAAGRAAVAIHDQPVAELGPGAGFGEIALLRSVARTATITALDDLELLAIDRGSFIEALTGQPRSATIATRIADEHLAADLARG
ncbi:MAG TPA: cyclic nucleotide-binding domain-containing protein [Candidatus Limnocylindrales bacterium]|nr:cyclic nucleotide-binding domain-containing protein [Candidatus Limnocylindrales bacterium]